MLSLYLSSFHDISVKTLFEQIYERNSKDIYKRIHHILKNEHDTEDVMQTIWLSVAENIDFYRDKNEAVTHAYILRMAKNQAITAYRRRKKERNMQTEDELSQLCGYDDEDMLLRICEKTDVAVICQCIDALDEIYSDTLNYYYLHGQTVKEIAACLNTKERTIRTRLARGREKLLELLEGRNLNER